MGGGACALILALSLSLPGAILALKQDSNLECHAWAMEGECRKNAGFMLDACASACEMSVMRVDSHPECAHWARKQPSECASNPGYMQVHCSASCGQAWQWNPLARSKLGLPPLKRLSDPGPDTVQTGLAHLDAALSTGHRLRQLFDEGEDPFGLPDDDYFMLSTSVGQLLLYAANSAALAARGLGGHLSGHGGQEARDRVAASAASVAFKAGRALAEQRVSEAALELWRELDAGVVHPLLAAIVTHGPEKVAPPSLGPHPEHAQLPPPPPLRLPKVAGQAQDGPQWQAAAPLGRGLGLGLGGQAGGPGEGGGGGLWMPSIGLGTCWLSPDETYAAVSAALEAGVRHIDTAQAYRNEAAVGRALRDFMASGSSVTREGVFVATKISLGESHGYAETKRLVERQLKELDTPYIDLYYIHGYPTAPHAERFGGTWVALEELVHKGKIRALGVSNFDEQQLEKMFNDPTFIVKPAVLQNKFDPYHQGAQLNVLGGDPVHAASSRHGVRVVGYSTLSGWPLSGLEAPRDTTVQAIARSHPGKTPHQVLLRWSLQRGVSVIPRSKSKEHILENASLLDFELSEAEMRQIDALEHLVASHHSKPARPQADHSRVLDIHTPRGDL